MAAPVAAVGLGAAGLGSVLSAFGAFQGGQASAAEANYQAGVAKMNQDIATQNANYATYAGEVQAQQQGIKTSQMIATTKAEQGAGGLDVSSGSNVAVRTSEYNVGQEDIALVRSDAAKRAYGYEVEGVQYGAQATLDQYAAAQSKIAGTTAAIGSLLGGASSVSSKWLSNSNPWSTGSQNV
jgi:hypothetical protein